MMRQENIHSTNDVVELDVKQTVLAAFKTGNPDIVEDVAGVIRTLYPKLDIQNLNNIIDKQKRNIDNVELV